MPWKLNSIADIIGMEKSTITAYNYFYFDMGGQSLETKQLRSI